MNKALVTFFAVALLLAGCTTAPPEPGGVAERRHSAVLEDDIAERKDIQTLLAEAERSSPGKARQLRTMAAEIAVANNDARQARLILALIEEPPQPGRRYIFLRARLALLEDDPHAVIEWTEHPNLKSMTLTEQEKIELGRIRAEAFRQTRSYVAAARELIFIDDLLATGERADNHERIFATLMKLPADSLTNHAKEAITSDLRGWLSLAAMTKRFQDNPWRQLEELKRWQKVWSSHPAARQLPEGLATLAAVVREQPDIIALLLPLHGDLGRYGRAIRDGFVGAHYELAGQPEIRIYDTSDRRQIAQIITQAQQDGAELIVGPLSREKVTRVANMQSLSMPVLALNRTTDGSVHPNVYQFGLAPEDEMIQVAQQVDSEGYTKALAIYPNDDWGRRNFETFRAHWNALGGTVVDSAAFSNQRDYSDLIKGLLNVDQSQQRATDLRRITGKRFEFTPRRRRDIDFILLLANQDQARGINPTLAFYYAEDLPVYSTSHVYEASDSRIDTIDLNGIRFCDIPWKLTNTGEMQQAIQSTWPEADADLASFYALGVDAYRVYPRLRQLEQIPEQRIYGATGVLRLNESNAIVRDLMWAQFRDGKVFAAPMIVSRTGTE